MEFLKNIYATLAIIFDDIDFFSVLLFILFGVPVIISFLNMGW